MDLRELPRSSFTRHPWETSRTRFFIELLAERGLLNRARAVLDVGAGDGYVARQLAGRLTAGASVVCFDANYTREHLEQRTAEPVTFVRERPAQRFDLLLLLDVLEHVEDDRAFLRELVETCVETGGHALCSVPAWPLLFGRHDVLLGHHRRYTPRALQALVREVGLEIVHQGNLFHSLVAPRLATQLVEWLRPAKEVEPGTTVTTDAGQWGGGRALTSCVEFALRADNRMSSWLAHRRLQVPGLSTWALCRRP